jgi:hypothetical protein
MPVAAVKAPIQVDHTQVSNYGKTLCVSPTLPTGRRLSTSFTAPQQHQGLILIPGKVKPSTGYSS